MSENEGWVSLTPKEFAALEVPQYFQAVFQEDYLIKTTALMNIIHQGFQVALRVYFPVENIQSMNLMKLFVIKVRCGGRQVHSLLCHNDTEKPIYTMVKPVNECQVKL